MFSRPSSVARTFGWWALARNLAVTLGILAWLAWRAFGKSKHLDPIYPILAAWSTLYITYRWRALRKLLSEGVLSVEKYRANPFTYSISSTKELLAWWGALFAAMLALIVYQALNPHP